MVDIVALNNIDHHDLKVCGDRGAVFGDNVNQALVFPNEFRELQREYPILFRKDQNNEYLAVALLGLDKDENVFLRGSSWDARYIPAVHARGPFSIGVRSGVEGVDANFDAEVNIDLDNPSVGREKGYQLFQPHGGQSPYLEYIVGVLSILKDGISLSKAFFSALEKLDLIEPVTFEVKIDETRQYSIPGIYSISGEKFERLGAEALADLHSSGILAYCYWVLASLNNVSLIVERKRVGQSA
ncbi:SapC family protein [Gimibacter soli]|uniref:SapC family protein n=1 Tax=Gimibacter soli TaxID=3024400 RepID=A0AAF0BLS6_9PROT|nr:SapC family protein [Gimibacter soli]WCL53476.1 SapC family protein [Gimibacter soli]